MKMIQKNKTKTPKEQTRTDFTLVSQFYRLRNDCRHKSHFNLEFNCESHAESWHEATDSKGTCTHPDVR